MISITLTFSFSVVSFALPDDDFMLVLSSPLVESPLDLAEVVEKSLKRFSMLFMHFSYLFVFFKMLFAKELGWIFEGTFTGLSSSLGV